MKKGIVFTSIKIIAQLIIEMTKNIFSIKVINSYHNLKEVLLSEKNYDFLVIDRTLEDCSAKDIFKNLVNDNITCIPPSILLVQEQYKPNEDGEGFSFILRKPFGKDEIIEAINFAILERNKKKLSKVLIVDDSPTSRKMLKKILTKHGFQCKESGNPIESINIAKDFEPDLIIVDYVMPGLNGVELAKKISKDDFLKSIPIILLSGSSNFNSIIEEGFNSGISAYFKKPVNEEEILLFFKKYFYTEIPSKILVLDDSSTRRKAIYSNLSINNNQVITTSSINKAIALLEDNYFNIILVDLILKNETAFDAVKAIRRINKEIPIIVYSSIADRKNIYKILELGASDFLWAPIEMRELILKVKVWLGYSKFNEIQNSIHSKLKKEEVCYDFMELIDTLLSQDKLNNIISSLVFIKNIQSDLQKFIRKSDKIGEYKGRKFIYFHNSNLVETLQICQRIKESLKENIKFGIATTDSVSTVEDLFKKAEKNIISL